MQLKKPVFWFLTLVAIVSFSARLQEDDLTKCFVKVKHEWSKPCAQCADYKKSYRVYFRNNCAEKLDVKCAAQEIDLRWRTFSRLSVAPGDTVTAYACKGTGKYLYWVRPAGDESQPFLSDEEINLQFRNQ
jgi:hypothetical protein